MSNSFFRSATRRSRSRARYASTEALENRALLAGDMAGSVIRGDLLLEGDRAANKVEVTVLDGDVVVRGLDGTTINGEPEFIAFAGTDRIPDDLILRMGEGSDEIVIGGGLVVGDTIDARLDAGANALSMVDATARNLFIRAAGANEILLQDETTITVDVAIRFSGNGDDTIVVDGADIGDDLSIRAGHGNNSIIVDGVSVGDDVAVAGGRSQDDVMVRDTEVDDDLLVKTRSGSDFVAIDSSGIDDRTTLSLGKGDDNVQANGVDFGRGMRAIGSRGTDAIEVSDDSTGRQLTGLFERTEVNPDLADERLNGTPNGLNTRKQAVEDALAALVLEGTLTITIDPATFSEGDGTAATGTVTTDAVLVRDLVVTLETSDDTAATVPATVTIAAGTTSATFDVTANDDDGPDATQVASITATADRHESASADVNVEDDDVLTLTVDATSVSESGAALTATLTRLSSTSDDLIVNISVDDESEVSVPSAVTILAGQSFVEFAITPENDIQVDGDQTVTITASEDGHNSPSVDVTVIDDDFLTLTVSLTEFSESAGTSAATGTVERASGSDEALVVNLVSSDTSAVTVPETVTIPAGLASITFDLSAVDDSAENDTTQIATITASAAGHSDSAVDVSVTDDDSLVVTINDANFFEGTTDTITATVMRTGTTEEEIIVSLFSSDTTALVVPEAVTIPAGQDSLSFEVQPVDDNTPDENQTVVITATNPGNAAGTLQVLVKDDDFLELTIDKTEISEDAGDGAARAKVRRESATDEALEVTLTNSDASEISIPTTVTIPAGKKRVFFNINAVDDGLNDATQEVTIAAAALNHTSSARTIDVTDAAGLTLSFPDDVNSAGEEVGAAALTGTVTREGDVSEELLVTLLSSDTSELTVTSVTIEAGSASATFPVDTVDDDEADLTQTVTITASADGFPNTTINVDVLDDDAVITATIDPSTISEAEGTTTVTLTRNSDTTDELIVNVSAPDSELAVPASVTFEAGEDTATFDAMAIDNSDVQDDRDVTITVDAPLHVGDSVSVTILDDEPQLRLSLADSLVGEAFGNGGTTATVRRNTATTEDLVVTVASSDESEATVPSTVTILAGQESVTFDIDVVDDDIVDGLQSVNLTVSATDHAGDSEQLQVNDDDANTIQILDSERSVASDGLLITKDTSYFIEGVTAPGAEVVVDADGDGDFDDDTVTANAAGLFSYTATLAAGGDNVVGFMTTDSESNVSTEEVALHLAEGTVIRFDSNVGSFDAELLDDDAPITVANFLGYLDRYTESIIHRAPPNFVIQGGGFVLDGDDVESLVTDDPIQNEFNPDNSNIRGTLSMAQLGGQPNSGTSGWFVSTRDNSSLDAALHTVFGRIIGDGMDTVDAIQALDIFDLRTALGNSALAETPLLEPFNEFVEVSGTVSGDSGAAVLTGVGTSFTTELEVGDVLRIDGGTNAVVSSIVSDTELAINTTLSSTVTDVILEVRDDEPPVAEDYIVFSSIGELLNDI